jgi:hypothetical protein
MLYTNAKMLSLGFLALGSALPTTIVEEEASKSCTGAATLPGDGPFCYHATVTGEKLDIKVKRDKTEYRLGAWLDADGNLQGQQPPKETGTMDLIGGGISPFECKGIKVTKVGQDLSPDMGALSHCLPRGVTVKSAEYCSDTNEVVVKISDSNIPGSPSISGTGEPVKCGSADDASSLFAAWKSEHGKSYASPTAEQAAFTTWQATHAKIEAHNAKGLSWTMGHNQFSDLTPAQFKAFLGYDVANATLALESLPEHEVPRFETLPAAFDIEAAKCTTQVKNQKQCGSCWAFSAVGAIEGQLCNGVTLSEQDLVSCDRSDGGCRGGSMSSAFSWVSKNGIASERAYPYKATTGTCDTAKEHSPVATVSGSTRVSSESALKSAVSGRPVSIAVDATCLQSYRSGILDDTSCPKNLDHGVLLTAYGSSPQPYWKVKNSWGMTFGESGYFRVAEGKGMLGIGRQSSYPTGVKAVHSAPEVFQWPSAFGGDKLSLTWSDCSNGAAHAIVTAVSPSEIPLGETTMISGEGDLDSDQGEGTVTIDMTGMGGVPLSHCSGPADKDLTCDIGLGPIKVGTLKFHGMPPQTAGHVTGVPQMELYLPAGLPASATESETTLKITAPDGSPVMCVKTNTAPM